MTFRTLRCDVNRLHTGKLWSAAVVGRVAAELVKLQYWLEPHNTTYRLGQTQRKELQCLKGSLQTPGRILCRCLSKGSSACGSGPCLIRFSGYSICAMCSITVAVYQCGQARTCLLTCWHCATGLHFTYPRDKQRAQEVKDKLIAAHDLEVHGGDAQQHQVCLYAVLLCALDGLTQVSKCSDPTQASMVLGW